MLTILNRIYNALTYSLNGLRFAYRFEWAFRLEILAFLISIPLAFIFGHTRIEKVFLISVVLLVLIVELINTAIEKVIDRISSEHHELSGIAKDIASSAVLIAILNALIVWLFIIF